MVRFFCGVQALGVLLRDTHDVHFFDHSLSLVGESVFGGHIAARAPLMLRAASLKKLLGPGAVLPGGLIVGSGIPAAVPLGHLSND